MFIFYIECFDWSFLKYNRNIYGTKINCDPVGQNVFETT